MTKFGRACNTAAATLRAFKTGAQMCASINCKHLYTLGEITEEKLEEKAERVMKKCIQPSFLLILPCFTFYRIIVEHFHPPPPPFKLVEGTNFCTDCIQP